MISITGHSHYIQTVQEGADLPDIEPLLRRVCRERFRRIDRFIQLSLLGSALCAEGRTVSPECGLYLGTGIGPIENNITVQETLFKHLLLPKPFHFVNTLGSSAGFYVCKNLNLCGQVLFIARRGAALEATLMSAIVDLRLGIVSQALVGAVEESIHPLSDHRARLNLPPGTSVAEGSHWMLLERGDVSGTTARIELKRFESQDHSRAYLSEVKPDVVVGIHPQHAHHGFHDSLNAAAVTGFLGGHTGERLALVMGENVFLIQK